MISKSDLKKIAWARLLDSEALFRARRYDGGIYLCGYAVEIALKARICKTLRWVGFPFTRSEFQNLASFKTHDLDVLLSLSGVEQKIKIKFLPEWSVVAFWDPEVRYRSLGTAKRKDLKLMINSARRLLRGL